MSLTVSAALTVNLAGAAYPPGSIFNPITLPASPVSVDFGDFANTPLPAPAQGDAAAVDAWYRVRSADINTLTLGWSNPFAIGVELWAIPYDETLVDIADATLLFEDASSTSFVFSVGEDQDYLLRLHPMDDANNAGTGTLTWSLAARPSGLIDLQADPFAYDSPSWLRVGVISATEDDDVEFEIDGTVVLTITTDATGAIPELTIPLEGIATGVHTVLARDVFTGQEDAETFTVLDVQPDTDAPTPDDGPTTAATGTVIRWVFELVGVGAMTYTFPNNPTEMTTPHAARVLNPEHTTAADGQPVIFEGEPVPVEWTATGVCFSQAHYDALEQWHALNRRFYVIDHHERAWVVTFESLDWSELRDPSRPWAHRYTMKFYIYDGPVTLP